MRLLVVKMSSLGDVVHALPAVADAISHGHQVDWVVEEAFAEIPALLPGIGRVIPIAWRRWRRTPLASRGEMRAFLRQLRATEYDLVLDSQGLIKSALVTLLARGPGAGFSHTSAREPWAAFAYRRGYRIARGQHAVDRQRQLFAAVLGFPAAQTWPVFAPAAATAQAGSEAQRRVFFLHGTTWATKHWPLSMWLELARLAAADGYTVNATWGNNAERERAQLLSRAGVRVLDRMPVTELAGHLSSAALVVGVDSGLTHLSAALGVPTLGLYGPTDAHLTGCRGARAEFIQADTQCAPCVAATCRNYSGPPLSWQQEVIQPPCFATLPPALVWQRCRQLLAARGPAEVVG